MQRKEVWSATSGVLHEVWGATYRGVRYEIVHWRLGWNYYIYLPLKQIPDEVLPVMLLEPYKSKLSEEGEEHTFFHYSEVSLLSNLDWHGGITFYEKHFDDEGKVDGIKLGCDYMHYFDEGRSYSLPVVESDAKHTIDALWNRIPNLKVRCQGNGRYYPASEMVEVGNNVTYHRDYFEKEWPGQVARDFSRT